MTSQIEKQTSSEMVAGSDIRFTITQWTNDEQHISLDIGDTGLRSTCLNSTDLRLIYDTIERHFPGLKTK
jgi:hypothetical protein